MMIILYKTEQRSKKEHARETDLRPNSDKNKYFDIETFEFNVAT